MFLQSVNWWIMFLKYLYIFGVNSCMLVTFYNAVICSIIVYGSVCWDGNISKFDRGRLEKIVKKQGMLWECHWTVLRHNEKRLLKKLMQMLNDPTHPMRHYFDIRCNNRSGRFLLPKTNTNHYRVPNFFSFKRVPSPLPRFLRGYFHRLFTKLEGITPCWKLLNFHKTCSKISFWV